MCSRVVSWFRSMNNPSGSVVVPLRATCPVWLVHGVQHTVTFGVRSRSRRFGSSVGRIVLSWYY